MRLAIVGAGAFGSWIALTGVRSGFETILVEQFEPANRSSSSAGPSRIIRSAYGRNELYTMMAQRSLKQWKTFFASIHSNDLFRRTGVLWLAHTSNPSIHSSREIFDRHRIPHEFLEAGAIRKRVPGMILSEGTVALFEPDGGALLAERSVRAVAQEAIRLGARYTGAFAEWNQSRNCLDISGQGTLTADVYVFACGSWLSKAFPDVLGNVIFPTRQNVFFFEAPVVSTAPGLPIWVDETDARVPYGFPDIDGAGIKLAFHQPGPQFDTDSQRPQATLGEIQEARDYLRSRFNTFGEPILRRADVCHYENTSGGDFLIDRHPTLTNVWFVGGGSGHGFKHAPAVAEYLFDAIQTGNSPERRFRLSAMGNRLNKVVV
jgi:sarcosine oxidase